MTKENTKRRRRRFQKTYMRYAKYIKSDLKLLKEKILKMELWTVMGKSSKSFPFPPWPFMAFAAALILENITARIIFWHSNVIASTGALVPPLPHSFGYLTSVTDKEKEGRRLKVFVVFFLASKPLSPSYRPQTLSCWKDHKCINNWASH